jgi:hypothetical protein
VPAQQVTVELTNPVAGARAFVPGAGTAAQSSFTDAPGDEQVLDAIDLEVSDQVQLLELLPRRAGGAAPKATSPPEVPEEPTATTEAPVVKGSSQPITPTTRAAGTGTPAAAARPTAGLDPASRSPLAFTGSTALSMLGASMLLLVVGVAALFASRRRYHHRH